MKLSDVWELIDKYSFVFSFLYTVITAIIGALVGKIFSRLKENEIRKCLSLTMAECKIVLPSYGKKYIQIK